MSEPLQVAIIGAGFSGIGAAIQLLERGQTNFRVFEKASGVGGTWYHNTYPGAACDVSSHLYCYSFEPNPNWSRVYSPQREIKAYIEHCVEGYGVTPYLELGREMKSVTFDDANSRWQIHFADDSQIAARHVIFATGGLHFPKFPAIRGIEQFQGPTMHSAHWDHAVELQNQRVLVIGSAASGIQIVPQVARVARQVTVFQRTANWILPRNDRDYTRREKARFRHWPWLQRLYRHLIFLRSDIIGFRIVKTKADNRVRSRAQAMAEAYVRDTVHDPILQEQLIPEYPLGCKRVLLSDDFYQSLNEEHVNLTNRPIDHIDREGIVTTDGKHHAADVIIYATGFDLDAWVDKIAVVGPAGNSLRDQWKEMPTAYRGACVPGFPNFYLVTGPNTGVGTTSILYMIEAQLRLIMQCIEKAGPDNLISVTERAHRDYNERIQQDLQNTVWAANCNSWYKRPDGSIPTLYPYNARTFKRQHMKLNTRHFEIVHGL